MKEKLYIFAALCVLLCSACTKVEQDLTRIPEKKVSFTVGTYVQTKTGENGGLIKELEDLGIASGFSFKTQSTLHTTQDAAGTCQSFMENETVNYTAGTPAVDETPAVPAVWAPARDYFWPAAATSYANFVSWYDYKGVSPTAAISWNGSSSQWEASLEWSDRTVYPKDDILFADVAWRYNSNAASTAPYGKDGVVEGVPTLFHHALALVKFQARVKQGTGAAYDTDPENPLDLGETPAFSCYKRDSKQSGKYTFWKVTLTGVTIKTGDQPGIRSKGTLSLSQTDKGSKGTKAYSLGNPAINWTPAASDMTYTTFTFASPGMLTTEAQNVMNAATAAMPEGFTAVMPQQVIDDMKISLTFTIQTYWGTLASNTLLTTETGITVNNLSLNSFLDSSSQPIANWEMNKKYIYTITIDPETSLVQFDPAVADWTITNVSVGID